MYRKITYVEMGDISNTKIGYNYSILLSFHSWMGRGGGPGSKIKRWGKHY